MASVEAEVPQVWRPGDVILDLYEVLQVIGHGGMGLVYRVRHRGWDLDLAVKAPRPELVASPKGMRLFETEAESWVRLGLHPHTVSCAYVRRLGGLPRVFAEWVDGGSLADAVRHRRIYEGGPERTLSRILDVSIQFAWGLEHAHANSLIHQDVKPANVMLTRDGTAKVTDFGLAKGRTAAGEDSSMRQSTPGTAVPGDGTPSLLASYGGLTPAYCSPEQAVASWRHGVDLTRATDVWSWAVSVLEMFTGGPPTRHGAAAAEAFEVFLERGPSDPGIPTPPDELVALLRRCFQHEPSARPRRMGELADELAEIYMRETGRRYPRTRPASATLLADGLSNQALSMLDLGHPEQADALWERALQTDPHHPHVIYNHGLRRWRAGLLSDAALVAELEDVGAGHQAGWVDKYLLALVHLERGDPVQAAALLRKATRLAPRAPEITAALRLAGQLPVLRRPVVLRGHTDKVSAVALSADGRLAVSGSMHNRHPPPPGSEQGTLRVWDLATRECLYTLPGHSQGVNAVALSHDGRLMASAGADHTVAVWDTGRLLHRLTDQPSESIALTPDGSLLVTAAEGGAVRVWEIGTGSLVHTLQRPQRLGRGYGGAVTVTADGRHVVRWEATTQRLRVWELATGYLVRSVQVRGNASLSSDGRIALVSTGAELQLWDLHAGRLLRTVHAVIGGHRVGISGDGGRALTPGPGSSVLVWDLESGRCLCTLPAAAEGYVESVALSADGRRGISGSSDGSVLVWDLPPGGPHAPWSHSQPRTATELADEADSMVRTLERADLLIGQAEWGAAAEEVRAARLVPGYQRSRELLDRWARLGSHGRRVGLLGAWQARVLPKIDTRHNGFVLSADGRLAMMPRQAFGEVQVWDLEAGRARQVLGPHGAQVTDSVFTPDGRRALTASEDRKVRVWDLETGQCLHVLTGHQSEVRSVAVSAGGSRAVSGDDDGVLRVWDLTAGISAGSFPVHACPVWSLAMSADGRTAFAGGHDMDLCVCDLEELRCAQAVPGRSGLTIPFGISGDSGIALSERFLKGTLGWGWVWDLKEKKPRHRLGDWEQATALAVSPDGRLGHAACQDGTIRVWDLVTGLRTHVLIGHSGPASSLAPSLDGRFTLTAGADGTVRVWDLVTGECLRTLEGHTGQISAVRLSADSRIAVSVGEDSTMRVWELDWDYEFRREAE